MPMQALLLVLTGTWLLEYSELMCRLEELGDC